MNRNFLEPIANRYFFVENPVEITVDGYEDGAVDIERPLHADHEDRGNRILPFAGKAYLASEDVKDGISRLMDAVNVDIDKAIEYYQKATDLNYSAAMYNLGLIYEVELEQDGFCLIKMTLTTMGCPLADVITDEIHRALKDVPEVTETQVKLVWYPAWTTDRMSRYARIALGIR